MAELWQCPSCKTWGDENRTEHDCEDGSNRLTLSGTPPLRIP